MGLRKGGVCGVGWLGSTDGDAEVASDVHTCRWKAVWMQQEVKESVGGSRVRTSLETAWLCRDRTHNFAIYGHE